MTPETLLDLQLIDTAADQLRHRLPRLPEVVAEAAAKQALAAWQAQHRQLTNQISDLEAAISTSEQASAEISRQRQRLEGQLKTVSALREAEALQHEISNLTEHRRALDDAELASMEAVADAEGLLEQLQASESTIVTAADSAIAAAAEARQLANHELARLAAEAQQLRSSFDQSVLSMYDEIRGQHDGVAIAKLNGLRCEGCHLDLSRAEVDQMKTAPSDQLTECPNCGRLLVR